MDDPTVPRAPSAALRVELTETRARPVTQRKIILRDADAPLERGKEPGF